MTRIDEGSARDFDIAVIGMAGRFPGASDLETFWRNLRDGVDAVRVFTSAELGTECPPGVVPAAGILDDIESFDLDYFQMSPRDAATLDPQHRLFLEHAVAALDDAGYGGRSDAKVAVYAGTGFNNYVRGMGAVAMGDALRVLIHSDKDFLATRVAHKLDLRGEAITVQTACSTSLVAIHLACQSILSGQSDMALAGGVSLLVPQRPGYTAAEGSIISRDGQCRAFDARANGTVFGSGVGVVVLKLLRDALADGDAIRAVIKGSAINNDGQRKAGYTAPSVEAQASVIASALAAAEVDASTIQYVEAHGTGTVIGDPIEIEALTRAYRKTTGRSGYCAIGSLKTNVGHMDTAAGVGGVIKTVLALEARQMPPSLHFESPNPAIDFAASPFFLNDTLRTWTAADGPRRAGVSSFGVGGTNAHVILEEAPAAEPSTEGAHDERAGAASLLVLSGKTAAALARVADRLADHLERNPAQDLRDVAYTLQVGRAHHPVRRAIAAGSGEAAIRKLREPFESASIQTGAGARVVFLFPGQGAQHAGMARTLYAREPVFREHVDACEERLRPMLDLDLRTLLFAAHGNGDADARLAETWLTQPALFVIEYALARLWMHWGIRPDALLGHSVGEYVAACLSGVLTLDAALSSIAMRGRLLQETPPGAMLSIPLPVEEVARRLSSKLSLAAINADAQCVVAGPEADVAALEASLRAQRIVPMRLRTQRAFHSALVEPALAPFADHLRGLRLGAPRIPYVSNVTGTWITACETGDAAYFVDHLRRTVRFADGLRTVTADAPCLLLEVGPGQSLTALVRRVAPKAALVPSLPRASDASADDHATLLEALGAVWEHGAPVGWAAVNGGRRRRRVPLPAYPFERTRCWIDGNAQDEVASAPAGKLPDPAQWMYVPTWRRREALALPAAMGGRTRWVIFLDDAGLGEALATLIEERGAPVRRVASAEDVDAVGESLFAEADGPVRVVHARSVGASASLDEELGRGLHSVLAIVRAHYRVAGKGALRIDLVSSDAQLLACDEPFSPDKAALHAVRRVIPQELPNVDVRAIDVAGSELVAAPASVAEGVLAELVAGTEASVALRGGERWGAALVLDPMVRSATSRVTLRPRGIYVLFGGFGTVGNVIADRLARAYDARLTLVTSRAFPPREEWDAWGDAHGPADATSRRIARVRELEALGASVLVAEADIANEEQVRRVLRATRERFGAAHGVFVGAATLRGPRMELWKEARELRPEDLERHLRPKARGVLALEGAVQDEELDFVFLHGSNSVVLGGAGTLAYAAANAIADAVALRHERDRTRWISVAWDHWQGLEGVDGGSPRTTEERPTDPQARAWLAEWVRLSMTPDEAWSVLNGALAIDRRQVVISTCPIAPRIAHRASAETSPPRRRGSDRPLTETEARLAPIWNAVLGVDAHPDDNFFELGGDSLLATQVISRVWKDFDLELSVRALFAAPTVAGLAQEIDVAVRSGRATQAPPLVPVPRDASLSLSFAQERLWFLDQLQPGNSAYNSPAASRITGPLDVVALEQSLGAIVDRHEALRTTFATRDGEPAQVIHPSLGAVLAIDDLRALRDADREDRAAAVVQDEVSRPFDLEQGPLVRARLVRVRDDDYILVLTMHHVVSDGWSLGVLVRELGELYASHREGRAPALSELPIQYADFAAWQRSWLAGALLEKQRAYWRDRLAGAPSTLDLPTDRPRPRVQTYRGRTHSFDVPGALVASLESLANREEATLFMVLLAAFYVFLARHTGQRDLCVGVPIANRNRAEVEGLIGFFVNTIVLRADLDGDPSFPHLLARVREATLGAFAHQDLPFEKLVEDLRVPRDMSRSPVVQVMFLLQNAPMGDFALPGADVTPFETDNATSRFDLSLSIAPAGAGLRASIQYASDLFDAGTIAGFGAHYVTLLEAIVGGDSSRVSSISMLGDRERERLLALGKGPEALGVAAVTPRIDALFAARAARHPERFAVAARGRRLTYGELAARADALAARLRAAGVVDGGHVAVAAERSVDLVVALLGVLQAGAAYVPLDPAYPKDRIDLMLHDCGACAVVTTEAAAHAVSSFAGPVIDLERLVGDARRVRVPRSPDAGAYVLYTSGSTGRPKGVVVPHLAVCGFFEAMDEVLGSSDQQTWLALTSICFDISVLELLWPLTRGHSVVIADPRAEHDEAMPENASVADALGRFRVTHVQCTPSGARALLADERARKGLASIDVLLVGGEALPGALAQVLRRTCHGRLLNMYGPTETTIWSSFHEVTSEEGAGTVPIGAPIRDTRMYVLDEARGLCPLGVVGELWIGGSMVAHGYLGRPELTAERFAPDPFAARAGARMYRTGDRVRWREDGRLEFLGRVDHQVKVRGHRIELGEIEATLLAYDGVREAVVVSREDVEGDVRLVAYLVPDDAEAVTQESAERLRAHLAARLPEFMLPAALVPLEALPRTPNGKIDRGSLPRPDGTLGAHLAYVAPRTELEQLFASIWAEALQLPRVSVHDNFFEIGGHSLLAIQVVSRMRKTSERKLPLRDFFDTPTIAALAAERASST